MARLLNKYAPPPNAIPVASEDLNAFIQAPVFGSELTPEAAYVGTYDLVLYDLAVYAQPDIWEYPPVILTNTPITGPAEGGTPVAIAGTGFISGAHVHFDGVEAVAVTVISENLITCISPPHAAGSVDIFVENYDGQTATRVGAFLYT